MTEEQRRLALRLSRCTFLPGGYEKRFVRSLAARWPLPSAPPTPNRKETDMPVEIIGPFEEYYLSCDGYRVPGLTAHPLNPQKSLWSLSAYSFGLDLELDEGQLNTLVYFVANAMARAAGYSSHGEHSHPHNPFNKQMIGLTGAEFDELRGHDEKPPDDGLADQLFQTTGE